MSKISVIIPCYNAACFITKCLDALERQTFTDFDVIVVDDCSTDETFSVVEKYATKSSCAITLLKNDVNSGPALSRNRGVESSNSEFVTFCDSDDWYADNFLETLITSIQENNADIAFCGYNVIDDSGNIECRRLEGFRFSTNVKEALTLDIDSLCMLMVKREIIHNCPFPNIRNGEDMAVIPILLCRCQRFCLISDCLYFYYTRSNSASNSISIKVVDSLEESFKFVKEQLTNDYYSECEYIGLKNWLYAGMITLFTVSYDLKKARSIIQEFEINFPNWRRNPNINNLALYKKVVLLCCRFRLFFVIRIVAILRAKMK